MSLRNRFGGAMVGKQISDRAYQSSRGLFLRGVGVIYLFAILSWWVQADDLVGGTGLSPMGDFLERAGTFFDAEGTSRVTKIPTLFWLSSSDAALGITCGLGVVFALFVVAGLAPGPCLLALWAIYLSLVGTGGAFMSFQWDILLLEVGVLAVLVAPWSVLRIRWKEPPPLGWGERVALWLCWFVVAKLMFQSGWVKLVWATPQNPEWWPEHTALTFHYMTQPLPTWTAWWMHQLPEWFHRLSLVPMYFIELVLPFCVFLGARLRLFAALGFAGLMILVLGTGNYTYFNWLTIVLCLPLVADRFCRRGAEAAVPAPEPSPRCAAIGLWVRAPFLFVLVLLNYAIVFGDLHAPSQSTHLAEAHLPWTHLETDLVPQPLDDFRAALGPFHLASGYGLFRTMTTERPEIVFEGSRDGVEWVKYDVRWKPDGLDERPQFVAPHQPRLAWQLWFAALEGRYHPRGRNAEWFGALVRGMLENAPSVLGFFEANPFPNAPPTYVRARLYRYEFTTLEERSASGNWWKRELIGEYLPPVSREVFR